MAKTQKEITDAVDVAMSVFVDSLAVKQAAYLHDKGRYFQGLPTHTAMPKDGDSAVADKLASKPTDQAESYSDEGLSVPAEAALRVDVYVTPKGQGYHVVCQVRIGEEYWEKIVSVGPDNRSHEWAKTDAPLALTKPIEPPK